MKNTDNILKLVTGNLNPEDKKKVLSEIRVDEEARNLFYKVKVAWAVSSSKKKGQDYDKERTYLALQERIKRRTSPFSLRSGTFLKYAAILIILVGIPALLYLNKNGSSPEINEGLKYTSVVADNGQISKIILPDSSVVWLNSGTTLTYNSGYAVTNRDLNLSGEAYLEVKKDSENPLIVSSNELKVRVLGTKFDVKAYPTDDHVQVVLESGSVQIFPTGDDALNYRLKPGEMGQYDIESDKIEIREVNTRDFVDWKEGYLVFNDLPMSEVVKKLERQFNIEILVKNKEVYKSIFNANFKDEGLAEILEYIQYSCPIRYATVKEAGKKKIELYYQPK